MPRSKMSSAGRGLPCPGSPAFRTLSRALGVTAVIPAKPSLPAASLAGQPATTLFLLLSAALLLAAVLWHFLRRESRKSRALEETMAKAFNISASAVYVCSLRDGTFLKVNDCFTGLTGFQAEEVLGKKAGDLGLWQTPEQYRSLVTTLKEKGEVRDLELSLTSRGGEERTVLVTASTLDFAGEVCLLAIIRDVSELKSARRKIEELCYYDADTGLPNRNLLLDRLNQLISLNSRGGRLAVVVYLGMDGCKGIVEGLGHAGSREVVRDIARRLTDTLRNSDTVAIMQRDELAIVLGGDLQEADIDVVIAKIERVFDTPIALPTGAFAIAASLGIACFPSDGITGEILLQNAHAAMNQARENRSVFQYYSASMNAHALERLRLESGMLRALELGEFFLCYQPKYTRSGKDITGMEALIRWRHQGEVIPPARFIPIAEENGTIVRLGEWVLAEACRQNKSWQDEGLSPLQVSVNISARQLLDGGFADKVERVLGETGLSPRFLELEITESAIMNISDDTILQLMRLKEKGMSISIDDFGTGYSSLSYLKTLPVDKIKIDRSFVMDIVSDPGDAAIVEAIISIARALDLGVIAEGVENRGQHDFLIRRECAEFQGYYFSKPLVADDFAGLLRASAPAAGNRPAGPVSANGGQPGRLAARGASPVALVERKAEAGHCDLMWDVANPVKPVSPGDRLLTVLSRFQLDPELKLLPVVEGHTILGLVSRSTFLEEHIIGRYGFAAHINHNKKIKDLMEPLEQIFDAQISIEEAAKILQPMIRSLSIDKICITDRGAYRGVLDVNRFINAMTDLQMVLAKGANPLTGLPGNASIERNISGRLSSDTAFDIAYFDIDNFKPFNDHYGFQKGDEVIKRLGEIMSSVASSSEEDSAFCGHIGGDDFILICEPAWGERLSAQVISVFEDERLAFHGARDCENGSYRAINRKGEPESFPLLSLSVGIVNTDLSRVRSYAELASLSTEVKKWAKKKVGSSIVIDGGSAGEREPRSTPV